MLPSDDNKRLTRKDFKIPKQIAENDFAELCGTFKIRQPYQSNIKEQLDLLTRQFAEWMTNEGRQPALKADRKQIEKARKLVKQTIGQLDQLRLSLSGRRASRTLSTSVAPMLSAQWLNETFQHDAPQRSRLPSVTGGRSPSHTPLRDPEYFIEEESLGARAKFVEEHPIKTICALFGEIEKGLETALRSLNLQPGARGGQKPLIYRQFLIINLAEIWRSVGHKVSTSAGSPFAGFCEAVALSIDWPTQGMSAAIPDAENLWRNLD